MTQVLRFDESFPTGAVAKPSSGGRKLGGTQRDWPEMEDEPSPRDAEEPSALSPDLDTESAFRLLVVRCCAEVDRQLAGFLEFDDPAGAHKARVALRRLTTTLDAFSDILRKTPYAAERATAKRIFRAIGTVREADVYLELRGGEASEKANAKAQKLRETVRRKLRKDRIVGYTPALLGKVSDGSLFRSKPKGVAARTRPIRETASAALQDCWDACMSFPADLADLSDARRHELRKALKGLRYTSEFFAPVWQSPHWPALRSLLRDAQDELGDLNDLVLARLRDGIRDTHAEAEALDRAAAAWAALRTAPRWWDAPFAPPIS